MRPISKIAYIMEILLVMKLFWSIDIYIYHIEAEAKLTSFRIRNFQVNLLNRNIYISIKISLKHVARGPIINILALVQVTAYRQPGGKSLSEPIVISLLKHVYALLALNELIVIDVWFLFLQLKHFMLLHQQRCLVIKKIILWNQWLKPTQVASLGK